MVPEIPDLTLVVYLPAIIFGAVAACFWIVALVLFIRAITVGSRGVRVQGRVIGHNSFRSHRHRRGLMFSAIYEAVVGDGRTLQCDAGIATSWKSPPVGTVVTLLYRPHDRDKPLVVLGFMRFLWCTIFAGIAAILSFGAVTALLSAARVSSVLP